jgi:hypothetical protein
MLERDARRSKVVWRRVLLSWAGLMAGGGWHGTAALLYQDLLFEWMSKRGSISKLGPG